MPTTALSQRNLSTYCCCSSWTFGSLLAAAEFICHTFSGGETAAFVHPYSSKVPFLDRSQCRFRAFEGLHFSNAIQGKFQTYDHSSRAISTAWTESEMLPKSESCVAKTPYLKVVGILRCVWRHFADNLAMVVIYIANYYLILSNVSGPLCTGMYLQWLVSNCQWVRLTRIHIYTTAGQRCRKVVASI